MSKQYEADSFIKTGGTDSQYLMANGTTSTGPSGGVDVGTGTANKVAKFSDSDTITDSIITDDGTNVLINGNLAIGTADSDNLLNIEATDNNYDISRALHIDYTKSHSTTGWGASAFGARVNVYADGTGQNADLQGGSFGATHIGSGVTYYLLGSQSNAKHEGSGNTGAIWGAFNQGRVSGTGTGTHPFLIGTNQKADLNNANASVGKMQAIVAYAKTTAGDITERIVAAELGLDCNQGAATAVDAAVLYLTADVSSLTTSGTARTINSVSTLPSVFLGSIESPRFNIGSEDNYLWNNFSEQVELYGDAGILLHSGDGSEIDISDVVVVNTEVEATSLKRTGGTSSQFLKADGSVDSSTYLTGSLPTDFVSAASGGTFNGALTINSDTDTIFKLNNSDNGAQYVTYSRSNDRHAYVGFGGSSDNFTIMSEETGGQIILGTAATTRLTIGSTGNVVIGGNTTSASFIKSGGTSSQFLKADGSVDSSTYSTTDTQPLTTEEVQDIVGAMVNSNTEQSISVTYSDGDGKLNFDAGAATFNHPTHPGDDASVDTGALTGAVVISDLDFNVTTDTFGHVTDANATVATRTLTLANLGFTGDVDATNDQTLNQVITSGNTYTNGTSIWTFDSGQISNVDSGEGWGVILSPEEGLLFTNGSGNTAGKSYVQSNAIAIGNGSYIGKIFTTNLTAERSFELPNAAGTLALTSQISTDFVSAAGGGTFNGDITADAVIVAGGTSTRFLKADGSLDANTYMTGAGSSGNIAIFNTTNDVMDTSKLAWNSITDTLEINGDIEATDIDCDSITSGNYINVPQTFQSNFVHTGGNSYMNLPFNSLSDSGSGGEQHHLVTPYQGYVHSVAFKNTATGNTMTGTNMNFRVLRDGTTIHTSSSQSFTAAARTYKGWVLASTDATFFAGNDLRFQFRCTSGYWQDTCAVVVLKCII
jgi:hypothetical protein